jgi:uncharacterized protein
MTKRIICTVLALVLCFGLAISVSAEGKEPAFVIDELGYLTDDGIAALNNLGSVYYDMTGVGIFFVYTKAESLEDYDVKAILNGITDYVIMMENETSWYVHVGGKGEIIDVEAEDALRAAYDADETYIGGIGAYMDAAVLYFPELTAAAETTEAAMPENEQFLYDEADLLNDSEEVTLVEKLKDVSRACNAQLVVVTIASMDGGDIDSYVDYLYDSMGFGYGENHDGVLLLVCMDPREYRILSNGYAGTAIGPDQIDTLCDFMETYLPNGHYTSAFHSFADQSGEFLEYYLVGSPFKVGKSLAISLIIGIIAGLIVAFILKGQLKSVRKQDQAHRYVKLDSMTVNIQYDIFLYRTVTRTKKQKRVESTSSGSGDTARSKGGGSF